MKLLWAKKCKGVHVLVKDAMEEYRGIDAIGVMLRDPINRNLAFIFYGATGLPLGTSRNMGTSRRKAHRNIESVIREQNNIP